jgi:endogenous inhibitor of DNA gyrase (YacG/DUF329 family)
MSKINRKCKNCKSPFQAKASDMKRGWGKFCSKSCKAIEQEKRTNGQYRRYLEDEADSELRPCTGQPFYDEDF